MSILSPHDAHCHCSYELKHRLLSMTSPGVTPYDISEVKSTVSLEIREIKDVTE